MRKFFPGVPDLAVEVISPNDTKREIAEKINLWLAHGTVSCWVADPESMTVAIHRRQKPTRLTVKDEITQEARAPGLDPPRLQNLQAAIIPFTRWVRLPPSATKSRKYFPNTRD